MGRAMIRWAAGIAVLASLAGCNVGKSGAKEGAVIPMAKVTLVDERGTPRDLGEFLGKVVVIDVWATWCPPCRKGLPEVAALQKKGGEAFVVVPISVDRNGWEDVRPFLASQPGLGLQAYVPSSPESLEPFGAIPGIPTTIILDRQGRVRDRWSGYEPGRAEVALEAALRAH